MGRLTPGWFHETTLKPNLEKLVIISETRKFSLSFNGRIMKYPELERPHKDQVQLSVLDKTTLELNYVSVSTVQTLITEIQKEP